MATDRDALRDWHRLFGLFLTDFFTDSPFSVDIERDLSQQQQFLDVVILRRGRGRFAERLPDGLDDLTAHNLITFKSLREALDDWAMKELIGHYVAYRKLVSPSGSELLPEDRFRLYAVCARFPHNLAGQVPWQKRQAGVYDCLWGTDVVRVVVAGELPQEAHNAPLHLFSASPALINYGRSAYRRRSERTSLLLGQLFERFQGEGFAMSYTMEDFMRDHIKERFLKLPRKDRLGIYESLPPEERREILESLPAGERREILESLPPKEQQEMLKALPPEERLAGLSAEQIQQYLDQLTAGRPAKPRKPRRKK
jgi:MgtE intracellular N domain